MHWYILFYRLSWVYSVLNIVLALFSLNILFLLVLSIYHRKPVPKTSFPVGLTDLPSVLIQLPIYNERYVVERLIDAAAALDYPPDRIIIQVIDDSTDETSALAQARADYHSAHGKNVQYLHRSDRTGYKASALSAGLAAAPGELVAVFDADFIPHPDFLLRMIPYLLQDPKLGILQARWEHLNLRQNAMTQVIALALDLHFGVDQVARSRSGMMMNCNGSGCIMRRECIQDSGGWQYDTLTEDTDLSYRAQLRGWRIDYRPEIEVPGELPASILAFKQQQFRWSKGVIQTFLKLAGQIVTAHKPIIHKIEGLIHLSTYIASPLMLISFLLSLPVVYIYGHQPFNAAALGVAAVIPPVAILYAQARLRGDWLRYWIYYPMLFLISIGLSVTITRAVWEALIGRKSPFVRTPKFSGANQKASKYSLSVDKATWIELALFTYGLGTAIFSLQRAPFLAPFIFMYAFGYGMTSLLGFIQARPRSGSTQSPGLMQAD